MCALVVGEERRSGKERRTKERERRGGQGEGRKKKGRGRLVGSPASLRDFHEEGPTRSLAVFGFTSFLRSWPAERERRPGMSITVSNIVLLYTLYGGTPYITVSRSETCRESELNLGQDLASSFIFETRVRD